MSNKRKCSATPPRDDVPRKKRLCDIQNTSASKVPTKSTTSPSAQPLLGRQKRPIRWRRGHNQNAKEPDPSPQEHVDQLPKQHKQPCNHKHNQESLLNNHALPPKQESQLRLSFSAPTEPGPGIQQQNQSLNQSFSELNMINTTPNLPTPQNSRSSSTTDEIKFGPAEEEIPFTPILSKPKKKREGYGFSYTDTFFLDSDEYPDTEGPSDTNADDEDQATEPSTTPTTSFIQNATASRPNNNTDASPSSKASESTLVASRSFTDLVVLRDIPSSPLCTPHRTLPCTPATYTDTLLLKSQAKSLLAKYRESVDIQTALLARLERMVLAEQKARPDPHMQALSVRICAARLCDFLKRGKEERVAMGEVAAWVRHEVEWGGWLVRAARKGVLHFRSRECGCRPDWGED